MIVPAYNEQDSIIRTCSTIKNKFINDDIVLDYIIINDGSTDLTKNKLIESEEKYIDLVCNLGIGGAVQTGYKYAFNHNYDVAIQFDGDGQHDIEYLEELIKPIVEGNANFTIGSRFVGNESKFKSTKIRRIGIGFLSGLIRLCTKEVIKDATSGFRAADREIIKLFSKEYPKDYPEPESIITLLKKGYIIKEIPVKMHERLAGESSISKFSSIYYMLKVSLAIIIANLSNSERGDESVIDISG